MVKAIIFDFDGMIMIGKRFSIRLAEKYNISLEKTAPFFEKELQQCLIGKADLKDELNKCLTDWGWTGTLDDILDFWFSEKNNPIDKRFFPIVEKLREAGVHCYLATNNEKYRVEDSIKKSVGKWFDGVFASCYLGTKKPSPEFLESIFKKIPNASKSEVIYWDDRPANIEQAKQFGFSTQLYSDFKNFEEVIDKLI